MKSTDISDNELNAIVVIAIALMVIAGVICN